MSPERVPRSVRIEARPEVWGSDHDAGLSLTVDPPARARLRVEAATPGLLRISSAGAPLLWARQLPRWGGVRLVAPAEVPRDALPLPPLTMERVRSAPGAPGSAAWLEHWGRRFVAMLAESSRSPLHDGPWELSFGGRRRGARDLLEFPARERPSQAFVDWGLSGSGDTLALRAPSRPDAARVKAWRKVARDGALPPLLLLFVSGLDLFLLLDGHDRALAARLEGVEAPRLALSPVREVTYDADEGMRAGVTRNAARALAEGAADDRRALDRLNERLVRAYSAPSFLTSKTRAAPIEGGRARWVAEVERQLDALGTSADRAIVAGLQR